MVREHRDEYGSEWETISSIASKFGCTGESLRRWVRQTERDAGDRAGLTTDERARLKTLERENRELRQANEILRKASAYLPRRSSTADRSAMIAFINDHREAHRGRADLQSVADRPVDLLGACGATEGSGATFGAGSARR